MPDRQISLPAVSPHSLAVIHEHWRTREQFGSTNPPSTRVRYVQINDAQHAVQVCRDELSWSVNVNHEQVKLELPESVFTSGG